eukprot:7305114-Pyramimonas_sp.AAC.1
MAITSRSVCAVRPCNYTEPNSWTANLVTPPGRPRSVTCARAVFLRRPAVSYRRQQTLQQRNQNCHIGYTFSRMGDCA